MRQLLSATRLLPIERLGRAAWLLAAALFLLTGCEQPDDIDRVYGKRRGIDATESVNGVGVLADMFEAAGHEVTTRTKLTPSIGQYDTIVWAPDDFQPPSEEARAFLEEWLYSGDDRVLVYIGRDYDAAITYWRMMLDDAPPEQVEEIARRLAKAQAQFDQSRARVLEEEHNRWFTARRRPQRKVSELAGPWSEGVEADEANIVVGEAFEKPEVHKPSGVDDPLEAEVLLAAEGSENAIPLVMRLREDDEWYDSRILVVANGSFLLNLPLVNREHRKLAGKLLDEVDSGYPRRVVFLESGPRGVMVHDEEPNQRPPVAWRVLTVWPLNAILIHLMVLGIVFCCARWPIFGRPRAAPASGHSDFGRHIAALGKLLSRTRNAEYARRRLQHYQQQSKRE